MKKLRVAYFLFLPLLSACLDEGKIEFFEDRVEVDIQADDWHSMALTSSFFLNLEKNSDNNPIGGTGRDVVFNANGIVPPSCTDELNCSSKPFDTIDEPDKSDPYGETYLDVPRDKLLISVLYGGYLPLYFSDDNTPNPAPDEKERRARWIKYMLDRLDMKLIGLDYIYYSEEYGTVDSLTASSSRGYYAALSAWAFVEKRLNGEVIGCQIEEWINYYPLNDRINECDGSSAEFEAMASWGRWAK
jgi:hypothetical protein